MKVLFLSHMFPNQLSPITAPFMLKRAKALCDKVNLDILAPVSYFPFLRTKLPAYVETMDDIEINHPRYLALPSFLWSFRWVSYLWMLEKALKNKNYNIFHIEWIYPDAFSAIEFAKRKGIRTVGVVHGNEAIDYFGPKGRRKKYIKVLSELDHIIVVSSDLKNKITNEYDIRPEKISTILNGVDSKKFKILDKNDSRKRLRLPLSENIGIVVARLSEEKNIEILINSVAKLGDLSPLFFIIGDGPLKNRLYNQIQRKKINDKIKMIGAISNDNIPFWLNSADFFCLPSKREGCPVVIHEALACGIPVISTNVGAIPDLICSNDYGLLCDHSNIDSLTDVIKKSISIEWDRKKISEYGQKFSWEKVANQTIKIYDEVIR